MTLVMLQEALETYRGVLLSATTLALAVVPLDINQSLIFSDSDFATSATTAGNGFKVAGLVLFVFPLVFGASYPLDCNSADARFR